MKTMHKRLSTQRGVSGMEYAVIAGIIVIALVAGATLLSGPLSSAFTDISSALTG